MKTLQNITGSQNNLTNFVAAIGLMTVALLVTSFAIMAIKNGINPF